jgi:hypothetical protein
MSRFGGATELRQSAAINTVKNAIVEAFKTELENHKGSLTEDDFKGLKSDLIAGIHSEGRVETFLIGNGVLDTDIVAKIRKEVAEGVSKLKIASPRLAEDRFQTLSAEEKEAGEKQGETTGVKQRRGFTFR